MQIRNVGVVSPGDMGQAIAGRLKESGLNVHAALDGRSERTKALARARPAWPIAARWKSSSQPVTW